MVLPLHLSLTVICSPISFVQFHQRFRPIVLDSLSWRSTTGEKWPLFMKQSLSLHWYFAMFLKGVGIAEAAQSGPIQFHVAL